MLNQIVLVGKLVETPELKELEIGEKYSKITIAVSRTFKNPDGEYEKDLIDIILFGNLAKNTNEFCKKGDVVGIKGRIQTKKVDEKNELQIIAEKITFLSSRKAEEKEEE